MLYYATWNYTGEYKECVCSDGSTPSSCAETMPDPPLFTTMSYSEDGPDGAWSEPVLIWANRSNLIINQTDDTNLAGIILENGTFIGMLRCGHWNTDGSEVHLVTAIDWKNNKTYIIDEDRILFPQLVPIATEDPFLYRDCDGGWHAIFHNMSPTRHDLPGGHAFSNDGINWIYSGYIYTQFVQYDDGTNFTFIKRQRPHFIFDSDLCTPIALTTGMLYNGGQYNDSSFTLLQPIKQKK